MKCKKHDTDLSSIAGVCASCLRERLIRIILAQEQSEPQSLNQNHRNSNSNPNPTVPRSVSPVISRRKSTNKPQFNHSASDKRFYNSPQVAIVTGGCIGGSSLNRKNPAAIRFPSISNLFRSSSRNGNRNGDADSNPRVSVSTSSERSGRPLSVTPSPSWFSNVLPGAGVRPKHTAVYVDESVRNRGMSPVRTSDDGEFSGGSRGYETTPSCKQTPNKTRPHNTVRYSGGQTSVTELIFRPLVRASPNRLLSLNGKSPVDSGFSGDVRAPAVPHLSYAKSFSGNRSRKLADFGRSDLNR